jgi:hypothetical protein
MIVVSAEDEPSDSLEYDAGQVLERVRLMG